MTDLVGNTFLEGPAGRIEAILKDAAAPVLRAAVVCHPHPLYGGTMHNKVVYRIARAFHTNSFAVLRFNFRGAGRSEGKHDHGRGEQEDLRAAIKFMRDRYPSAVLWLGGFSFGAGVMLRTGCTDECITGLVAAGLPVSTAALDTPSACEKIKLFVQGSNDQFGSVPALEDFVSRLDEPKQMTVIAGADHFFERHLDEMERTVSRFLGSAASLPP